MKSHRDPSFDEAVVLETLGTALRVGKSVGASTGCYALVVPLRARAPVPVLPEVPRSSSRISSAWRAIQRVTLSRGSGPSPSEILGGQFAGC